MVLLGMWNRCSLNCIGVRLYLLAVIVSRHIEDEKINLDKNKMNERVTEYISEAPEAQKEIMEELRRIIHKEVTSVTENFKWSRPVFSTDTGFAYFKIAKSYLTFGIFKFDKIKYNRHLLEGTGKDMRHIKIKKIDDIQPTII